MGFPENRLARSRGIAGKRPAESIRVYRMILQAHSLRTCRFFGQAAGQLRPPLLFLPPNRTRGMKDRGSRAPAHACFRRKSRARGPSVPLCRASGSALPRHRQRRIRCRRIARQMHATAATPHSRSADVSRKKRSKPYRPCYRRLLFSSVVLNPRSRTPSSRSCNTRVIHHGPFPKRHIFERTT
jgi:hypothetical protein